MKKIIVVVLALTLVLAGAVSVMATETDSYTDTDTYKWVYNPDPSIYYKVSENWHINWHAVDFEDGTFKFNFNWKGHIVGIGEKGKAPYGRAVQIHVQEKAVFNQQTGNGGVFNGTYKYSIKIFDTLFQYQLVWTYANGEMRVWHERISP